ncbi:MAG: VOC family protein [Armatimonas sp.]
MRLQNVVLPTGDYQQSVAFYRDALELPVIHAGEMYCFLRMGTVQLAIHRSEPDSPFAPTGHGYYLDLQVDNLAEIKKKLTGAGVAFLREWAEDGTDFLLVADPDGNRLELYSSSAS